MSLYNLLHGENPIADLLLMAIGMKRDDFYRYRDCYLTTDKETGEQKIIVHTRGGGGNREDGREFYTANIGNQHYLQDDDDDFDRTYMNFVFRVPEECKELFATLSPSASDSRTPGQKWKELFEAMEKKDPNDPTYQRAMKVGEKLMETMKRFLEKAPDPNRKG